MIVLFATHSTSLDSEAGIASGHHDVALSATGRLQSAELGEHYARHPLAAVFSSDLRRAVETAEIAFPAGSVSLCRDARLREVDYGHLTRQPSALLDGLRGEHVQRPFPGGESYAQAAARVAAFLEELRQSFAGGTVLLIGHRATWYALEHLLAARDLSEVVTAPFLWQPGWEYRMPDGGPCRL